MDLPKHFKLYLISQGCSPLTVKNYLSDVKDFFDWLAQKTGIHYQTAGQAIFGIFTKETIREYQQDLMSAKTPHSTINRHLSALRKLGEFARSQGWLSENPATKVKNFNFSSSQITSQKILKNFKKYLEKEKKNPLTIKNYLSDVRHFLEWIEMKK